MKEKMWICIQSNGDNRRLDWHKLDTLSYNRKTSIEYLIKGTTLTWEEARKKYGWRCVKVEIKITELI